MVNGRLDDWEVFIIIFFLMAESIPRRFRDGWIYIYIYTYISR